MLSNTLPNDNSAVLSAFLSCSSRADHSPEGSSPAASSSAQSSSSANSPALHPDLSARALTSSSSSLAAEPPASLQPRPEPPDAIPYSNADKTARLELSSDQPLTTHGKPRERVYLACVQCRNRKVRCDGAKPDCFNCLRRADITAGPCSYDPAPRRRGKDRTPGSRKLAPFEVKKTRTTRSRVEEADKRRKAEAAAAAAQAQAAAMRIQETQSILHRSSARVLETSLAGPSQTSNRPVLGTMPTASHMHTHPAQQLVVGDVPSPPVFVDFEPSALFSPSHDLTTSIAYSQFIYVEDGDDPDDRRATIFAPPGVQFTRETWWDALLASYTRLTGEETGLALTLRQREIATHRIAADLRFFFHVSLHWFSFLNIPRFFAAFFDTYQRQTLQPSLILSALALSTFFQSSELERGSEGRARALELLDQAHACLDASLSSGWIDVGLVQAAWLLAMFEIQAHPKAQTSRSRSAFIMLDSLIRSLSLTTLDVSDPRTSTFSPGAVPAVPSSGHVSPTSALPGARSFPMMGIMNSAGVHDFDGSRALAQMEAQAHAHTQTRGVSPLNARVSGTAAYIGGIGASMTVHGEGQCGCSAYSLGYNWPMTQDLAPAWANMPMWPRGEDVGEGEVVKEECRRLVWSTVMLTASHSTKTTAGTDREPQHLWIKDPSNYALLFPGESLVHGALGGEYGAGIAFSKDSMWALYIRTLLLWHSCFRVRIDTSMSDMDRAQYAVGAWLELDNVEAAMDQHTCGIQSGFMLQMREVLFNTRMVVSNDFKKYIPEALTSSGQLFYHQKAKKWMHFMLHMATHIGQDLYGKKGQPSNTSRRCFILYWYMSQIMRSLALWYANPSLTVALEVAKAFAPCVEYMMLIWPSPSQRREYEALRNWLVRSCYIAGIPPPTRDIPATAPGSNSAAIPPPTAAAAEQDRGQIAQAAPHAGYPTVNHNKPWAPAQTQSTPHPTAIPAPARILEPVPSPPYATAQAAAQVVAPRPVRGPPPPASTVPSQAAPFAQAGAAAGWVEQAYAPGPPHT